MIRGWLRFTPFAIGIGLWCTDMGIPYFFLCSDPGFCNTNLNMVHVRVDMSIPENQNPKPHLEDNEFIECFSVQLTSLFDETKKLEAEGYAIDARIGTLAEGIELAKNWRL